MNWSRSRPSRGAFDDVVDADGALLAVGLPPEWVSPLLAARRDAGSTRDCRLLLGDDGAARLTARFATDARVAAGIEAGRLAVRQLSESPPDRLVLADDRATLFVSLGDELETLSAADAPTVRALRAKYDALWEGAATYEPRAPPWDRLLERAADAVSPAFAESYGTAIRSASPVRWGDEPCPVEVALVVAGRRGEMLNDVSSWADDVGLASPSSCSRAKQRLVEADLLATERVPQGVGRPRQRLDAASPVHEAPVEDVVADTRRELAE